MSEVTLRERIARSLIKWTNRIVLLLLPSATIHTRLEWVLTDLPDDYEAQR